jgi:ketosteroid isomerase-like protein
MSVAIASGCASVAGDDGSALRSLVDAERAFAAMSLASGIRTAFAANFAADGIVFEPAPVDAPRAFFSRPEPPDAKPLVLEWQPAAAGISAAGDLGFTTGPSTLTDPASGRSREAVYFSMWKRERAGPWRVALDIGIRTPARIAPAALEPSPTLAKTRADPARARPEIVSIEAREVDAREYASWFAADGRLHREGIAPFVGDAAVRAHLATLAGTTLAFTPQGGAVSSSGDLAYTYGTIAASGDLPGGYYAHAWARDASGRWRLVAAVLLPSK